MEIHNLRVITLPLDNIILSDPIGKIILSRVCTLKLSIVGNCKLARFSMQTSVRDVWLAIVRNVFGTCADKMNADCGIDIFNLMLKSH